jgi:hypothetical protein
MAKMVLSALLLIPWISLSGFAQSPKIIAEVALTNQTDPIQSTKLANPDADALYRVSVYVEVTATNQYGAAWCLTVGWTDPVAPRSKQLVIDTSHDTGEPVWTYTSIVARDVADKPLGYAVSQCAAGPIAPYDLFITVGQLQ